jgi:hypothetical protein
MLALLVIGLFTDLVIGSIMPPRVAFEVEMNRYLRERGFPARVRAASTPSR